MLDKPIAAQILNALHLARGKMFPEDDLRTHVNVKRVDKLSRDNFKEQLHEMRAKGWIDSEVDDFGDVKWWVTDAGIVVRKQLEG